MTTPPDVHVTTVCRRSPGTQRISQVVGGRLGPVGDVALAQDVLDVELDGAFGDDEGARDLCVGLALDHVLEHIHLAAREQLVQARVAGGRAGGGRDLAVVGEVDRAVGELDYIVKQIPHLSSLLCNTIDEVIRGSDVIVVGNQAPEFAQAVMDCRADQIVIDLVRLPIYGSLLKADYRGICW